MVLLESDLENPVYTQTQNIQDPDLFNKFSRIGYALLMCPIHRMHFSFVIGAGDV